MFDDNDAVKSRSKSIASPNRSEADQADREFALDIQNLDIA